VDALKEIADNPVIILYRLAELFWGGEEDRKAQEPVVSAGGVANPLGSGDSWLGVPEF